ncbi:MAG: zinc-dependent alcohol dehydrogenase family protein [Pirellulales bacterium]
MRAHLLERLQPIDADSQPLRWCEVPEPTPAAGELLIEVAACGVCHTELDEIEGRTPPATLPMIPGHQAAGRVIGVGEQTSSDWIGRRVGVAWIASACGHCSLCRSGRENLCSEFQATGRDRWGGYAERMTARVDFVVPLPDSLTDEQAAPLLCAGAIGYRSLRLTQLSDGRALGLTGFGASAHLVLKMVQHRFPNSPVMVFARSEAERRFALELGAAWAGDTGDRAPQLLDAVIDTTPAWRPVLSALENLAPGGRLVVNAIRKESRDLSALLSLDYPRHLWLEKEIKSVANVTRQDVHEFVQLAAAASLHPAIQLYPFADANRALVDLKLHSLRGAKVLAPP